MRSNGDSLAVAVLNFRPVDWAHLHDELFQRLETNYVETLVSVSLQKS